MNNFISRFFTNNLLLLYDLKIIQFKARNSSNLVEQKLEIEKLWQLQSSNLFFVENFEEESF